MKCTLLICSFNESNRIIRCLDSIIDAEMPDGFCWDQIVVLAGASNDGTSEVVTQWASAHLAISLQVVTSESRNGKAYDLGLAHSQLINRHPTDHVVLVIDADVKVAHKGSLTALLEPLIDSDAPCIVWGVDLPDDKSYGRWASAFQMELCTKLAKTLGSDVPRAYGRFFAYRLDGLRDFTWKGGEIVDDIQISKFAEENDLKVQSAWNAIVFVTPAKGFRDFYLQTYRYYRAESISHSGHSRITRVLKLIIHLDAVLSVFGDDPMGAMAYLFARVVAAIVHRMSRIEFTDDWIPPLSTKGPVGG